MSAGGVFHILHGDDGLRLEEALENFRARVRREDEAGLNLAEFDGDKVRVPQLLGAVSTAPFLARRRVAIVHGLLTRLTQKGAGKSAKSEADRLWQALPALPETAWLLLVDRHLLPENSRYLKLAAETAQARAQACRAPRERDRPDWIARRAQETHGAQIEPAAARALAEVCGADLRRADNELLKLAAYVDAGRAIREEDVALLTPWVAEASIFAMVDALAAGRTDTAMRLLQRLLEDARGDGFGIFGMIVRQYRLLLLAKEHGRRPGLEEALDTRSRFVANKVYGQARMFTLAQLETIHRHLQASDVAMKSGKIAPRLALDLLVAGLARRGPR